VGRTTEEKAVTVAPAVLATYVGIYQVQTPTGTRQLAGTAGTSFTVTLEEGQLLIDLRGKGKVPMVPLSQTMFSPRLLGTYEFVKDASGRVTHMLVHSAEEVLTAVRQP
jgi:hypothetical protein